MSSGLSLGRGSASGLDFNEVQNLHQQNDSDPPTHPDADRDTVGVPRPCKEGHAKQNQATRGRGRRYYFGNNKSDFQTRSACEETLKPYPQPSGCGTCKKQKSSRGFRGRTRKPLDFSSNENLHDQYNLYPSSGGTYVSEVLETNSCACQLSIEDLLRRSANPLTPYAFIARINCFYPLSDEAEYLLFEGASRILSGYKKALTSSAAFTQNQQRIRNDFSQMNSADSSGSANYYEKLNEDSAGVCRPLGEEKVDNPRGDVARKNGNECERCAQTVRVIETHATVLLCRLVVSVLTQPDLSSQLLPSECAFGDLEERCSISGNCHAFGSGISSARLTGFSNELQQLALNLQSFTGVTDASPLTLAATIGCSDCTGSPANVTDSNGAPAEWVIGPIAAYTPRRTGIGLTHPGPVIGSTDSGVVVSVEYSPGIDMGSVHSGGGPETIQPGGGLGTPHSHGVVANTHPDESMNLDYRGVNIMNACRRTGTGSNDGMVVQPGNMVAGAVGMVPVATASGPETSEIHHPGGGVEFKSELNINDYDRGMKDMRTDRNECTFQHPFEQTVDAKKIMRLVRPAFQFAESEVQSIVFRAGEDTADESSAAHENNCNDSKRRHQKLSKSSTGLVPWETPSLGWLCPPAFRLPVCGSKEKNNLRGSVLDLEGDGRTSVFCATSSVVFTIPRPLKSLCQIMDGFIDVLGIHTIEKSKILVLNAFPSDPLSPWAGETRLKHGINALEDFTLLQGLGTLEGMNMDSETLLGAFEDRLRVIQRALRRSVPTILQYSNAKAREGVTGRSFGGNTGMRCSIGERRPLGCGSAARASDAIRLRRGQINYMIIKSNILGIIRQCRRITAGARKGRKMLLGCTDRVSDLRAATVDANLLLSVHGGTMTCFLDHLQLMMQVLCGDWAYRQLALHSHRVENSKESTFVHKHTAVPCEMNAGVLGSNSAFTYFEPKRLYVGLHHLQLLSLHFRPSFSPPCGVPTYFVSDPTAFKPTVSERRSSKSYFLSCPLPAYGAHCFQLRVRVPDERHDFIDDKTSLGNSGYSCRHSTIRIELLHGNRKIIKLSHDSFSEIDERRSSIDETSLVLYMELGAQALTVWKRASDRDAKWRADNQKAGVLGNLCGDKCGSIDPAEVALFNTSGLKMVVFDVLVDRGGWQRNISRFAQRQGMKAANRDTHSLHKLANMIQNFQEEVVFFVNGKRLFSAKLNTNQSSYMLHRPHHSVVLRVKPSGKATLEAVGTPEFSSGFVMELVKRDLIQPPASRSCVSRPLKSADSSLPTAQSDHKSSSPCLWPQNRSSKLFGTGLTAEEATLLVAQSIHRIALRGWRANNSGRSEDENDSFKSYGQSYQGADKERTTSMNQVQDDTERRSFNSNNNKKPTTGSVLERNIDVSEDVLRGLWYQSDIETVETAVNILEIQCWALADYRSTHALQKVDRRSVEEYCTDLGWQNCAPKNESHSCFCSIPSRCSNCNFKIRSNNSLDSSRLSEEERSSTPEALLQSSDSRGISTSSDAYLSSEVTEWDKHSACECKLRAAVRLWRIRAEVCHSLLWVLRTLLDGSHPVVAAYIENTVTWTPVACRLLKIIVSLLGVYPNFSQTRHRDTQSYSFTSRKESTFNLTGKALKRSEYKLNNEGSNSSRSATCVGFDAGTFTHSEDDMWISQLLHRSALNLLSSLPIELLHMTVSAAPLSTLKGLLCELSNTRLVDNFASFKVLVTLGSPYIGKLLVWRLLRERDGVMEPSDTNCMGSRMSSRLLDDDFRTDRRDIYASSESGWESRMQSGKSTSWCSAAFRGIAEHGCMPLSPVGILRPNSYQADGSTNLCAQTEEIRDLVKSQIECMPPLPFSTQIGGRRAAFMNAYLDLSSVHSSGFWAFFDCALSKSQQQHLSMIMRGCNDRNERMPVFRISEHDMNTSFMRRGTQGKKYFSGVETDDNLESDVRMRRRAILSLVCTPRLWLSNDLCLTPSSQWFLNGGCWSGVIANALVRLDQFCTSVGPMRRLLTFDTISAPNMRMHQVTGRAAHISALLATHAARIWTGMLAGYIVQENEADERNLSRRESHCHSSGNSFVPSGGLAGSSSSLDGLSNSPSLDGYLTGFSCPVNAENSREIYASVNDIFVFGESILPGSARCSSQGERQNRPNCVQLHQRLDALVSLERLTRNLLKSANSMLEFVINALRNGCVDKFVCAYGQTHVDYFVDVNEFRTFLGLESLKKAKEKTKSGSLYDSFSECQHDPPLLGGCVLLSSGVVPVLTLVSSLLQLACRQMGRGSVARGWDVSKSGNAKSPEGIASTALDVLTIVLKLWPFIIMLACRSMLALRCMPSFMCEDVESKKLHPMAEACIGIISITCTLLQHLGQGSDVLHATFDNSCHALKGNNLSCKGVGLSSQIPIPSLIIRDALYTPVCESSFLVQIESALRVNTLLLLESATKDMGMYFVREHVLPVGIVNFVNAAYRQAGAGGNGNTCRASRYKGAYTSEMFNVSANYVLSAAHAGGMLSMSSPPYIQMPNSHEHIASFARSNPCSGMRNECTKNIHTDAEKDVWAVSDSAVENHKYVLEPSLERLLKGGCIDNELKVHFAAFHPRVAAIQRAVGAVLLHLLGYGNCRFEGSGQICRYCREKRFSLDTAETAFCGCGGNEEKCGCARAFEGIDIELKCKEFRLRCISVAATFAKRAAMQMLAEWQQRKAQADEKNFLSPSILNAPVNFDDSTSADVSARCPHGIVASTKSSDILSHGSSNRIHSTTDRQAEIENIVNRCEWIMRTCPRDLAGAASGFLQKQGNLVSLYVHRNVYSDLEARGGARRRSHSCMEWGATSSAGVYSYRGIPEARERVQESGQVNNFMRERFNDDLRLMDNKRRKIGGTRGVFTRNLDVLRRLLTQNHLDKGSAPFAWVRTASTPEDLRPFADMQKQLKPRLTKVVATGGRSRRRHASCGSNGHTSSRNRMVCVNAASTNEGDETVGSRSWRTNFDGVTDSVAHTSGGNVRNTEEFELGSVIQFVLKGWEAARAADALRVEQLCSVLRYICIKSMKSLLVLWAGKPDHSFLKNLCERGTSDVLNNMATIKPNPETDTDSVRLAGDNIHPSGAHTCMRKTSVCREGDAGISDRSFGSERMRSNSGARGLVGTDCMDLQVDRGMADYVNRYDGAVSHTVLGGGTSVSVGDAKVVETPQRQVSGVSTATDATLSSNTGSLLSQWRESSHWPLILQLVVPSCMRKENGMIGLKNKSSDMFDRYSGFFILKAFHAISVHLMCAVPGRYIDSDDGDMAADSASPRHPRCESNTTCPKTLKSLPYGRSKHNISRFYWNEQPYAGCIKPALSELVGILFGYHMQCNMIILESLVNPQYSRIHTLQSTDAYWLDMALRVLCLHACMNTEPLHMGGAVAGLLQNLLMISHPPLFSLQEERSSTAQTCAGDMYTGIRMDTDEAKVRGKGYRAPMNCLDFRYSISPNVDSKRLHAVSKANIDGACSSQYVSMPHCISGVIVRIMEHGSWYLDCLLFDCGFSIAQRIFTMQHTFILHVQKLADAPAFTVPLANISGTTTSSFIPQFQDAPTSNTSKNVWSFTGPLAGEPNGVDEGITDVRLQIAFSDLSGSDVVNRFPSSAALEALGYSCATFVNFGGQRAAYVWVKKAVIVRACSPNLDAGRVDSLRLYRVHVSPSELCITVDDTPKNLLVMTGVDVADESYSGSKGSLMMCTDNSLLINTKVSLGGESCLDNARVNQQVESLCRYSCASAFLQETAWRGFEMCLWCILVGLGSRLTFCMDSNDEIGFSEGRKHQQQAYFPLLPEKCADRRNDQLNDITNYQIEKTTASHGYKQKVALAEHAITLIVNIFVKLFGLLLGNMKVSDGQDWDRQAQRAAHHNRRSVIGSSSLTGGNKVADRWISTTSLESNAGLNLNLENFGELLVDDTLLDASQRHITATDGVGVAAKIELTGGIRTEAFVKKLILLLLRCVRASSVSAELFLRTLLLNAKTLPMDMLSVLTDMPVKVYMYQLLSECVKKMPEKELWVERPLTLQNKEVFRTPSKEQHGVNCQTDRVSIPYKDLPMDLNMVNMQCNILLPLQPLTLPTVLEAAGTLVQMVETAADSTGVADSNSGRAGLYRQGDLFGSSSDNGCLFSTSTTREEAIPHYSRPSTAPVPTSAGGLEAAENIRVGDVPNLLHSSAGMQRSTSRMDEPAAASGQAVDAGVNTSGTDNIVDVDGASLEGRADEGIAQVPMTAQYAFELLPQSDIFITEQPTADFNAEVDGRSLHVLRATNLGGVVLCRAPLTYPALQIQGDEPTDVIGFRILTTGRFGVTVAPAECVLSAAQVVFDRNDVVGFRTNSCPPFWGDVFATMVQYQEGDYLSVKFSVDSQPNGQKCLHTELHIAGESIGSVLEVFFDQETQEDQTRRMNLVFVFQDPMTIVYDGPEFSLQYIDPEGNRDANRGASDTETWKEGLLGVSDDQMAQWRASQPLVVESIKMHQELLMCEHPTLASARDDALQRICGHLRSSAEVIDMLDVKKVYFGPNGITSCHNYIPNAKYESAHTFQSCDDASAKCSSTVPSVGLKGKRRNLKRLSTSDAYSSSQQMDSFGNQDIFNADSDVLLKPTLTTGTSACTCADFAHSTTKGDSDVSISEGSTQTDLLEICYRGLTALAVIGCDINGEGDLNDVVKETHKKLQRCSDIGSGKCSSWISRRNMNKPIFDAFAIPWLVGMSSVERSVAFGLSFDECESVLDALCVLLSSSSITGALRVIGEYGYVAVVSKESELVASICAVLGAKALMCCSLVMNTMRLLQPDGCSCLKPTTIKGIQRIFSLIEEFCFSTSGISMNTLDYLSSEELQSLSKSDSLASTNVDIRQNTNRSGERPKFENIASFSGDAPHLGVQSNRNVTASNLTPNSRSTGVQTGRAAAGSGMNVLKIESNYSTSRVDGSVSELNTDLNLNSSVGLDEVAHLCGIPQEVLRMDTVGPPTIKGVPVISADETSKVWRWIYRVGGAWAKLLNGAASSSGPAVEASKKAKHIFVKEFEDDFSIPVTEKDDYSLDISDSRPSQYVLDDSYPCNFLANLLYLTPKQRDCHMYLRGSAKYRVFNLEGSHSFWSSSMAPKFDESPYRWALRGDALHLACAMAVMAPSLLVNRLKLSIENKFRATQSPDYAPSSAADLSNCACTPDGMNILRLFRICVYFISRESDDNKLDKQHPFRQNLLTEQTSDTCKMLDRYCAISDPLYGWQRVFFMAACSWEDPQLIFQLHKLLRTELLFHLVGSVIQVLNSKNRRKNDHRYCALSPSVYVAHWLLDSFVRHPLCPGNLRQALICPITYSSLFSLIINGANLPMSLGLDAARMTFWTVNVMFPEERVVDWWKAIVSIRSLFKDGSNNSSDTENISLEEIETMICNELSAGIDRGIRNYTPLIQRYVAGANVQQRRFLQCYFDCLCFCGTSLIDNLEKTNTWKASTVDCFTEADMNKMHVQIRVNSAFLSHYLSCACGVIIRADRDGVLAWLKLNNSPIFSDLVFYMNICDEIAERAAAPTNALGIDGKINNKGDMDNQGSWPTIENIEPEEVLCNERLSGATTNTEADFPVASILSYDKHRIKEPLFSKPKFLRDLQKSIFDQEFMDYVEVLHRPFSMTAVTSSMKVGKFSAAPGCSLMLSAVRPIEEPYCKENHTRIIFSADSSFNHIVAEATSDHICFRWDHISSSYRVGVLDMGPILWLNDDTMNKRAVKGENVALWHSCGMSYAGDDIVSEDIGHELVIARLSANVRVPIYAVSSTPLRCGSASASACILFKLQENLGLPVLSLNKDGLKSGIPLSLPNSQSGVQHELDANVLSRIWLGVAGKEAFESIQQGNWSGLDHCAILRLTGSDLLCSFDISLPGQAWFPSSAPDVQARKILDFFQQKEGAESFPLESKPKIVNSRKVNRSILSEKGVIKFVVSVCCRHVLWKIDDEVIAAQLLPPSCSEVYPVVVLLASDGQEELPQPASTPGRSIWSRMDMVVSITDIPPIPVYVPLNSVFYFVERPSRQPLYDDQPEYFNSIVPWTHDTWKAVLNIGDEEMSFNQENVHNGVPFNSKKAAVVEADSINSTISTSSHSFGSEAYMDSPMVMSLLTYPVCIRTGICPNLQFCDTHQMSTKLWKWVTYPVSAPGTWLERLFERANLYYQRVKNGGQNANFVIPETVEAVHVESRQTSWAKKNELQLTSGTPTRQSLSQIACAKNIRYYSGGNQCTGINGIGQRRHSPRGSPSGGSPGHSNKISDTTCGASNGSCDGITSSDCLEHLFTGLDAVHPAQPFRAKFRIGLSSSKGPRAVGIIWGCTRWFWLSDGRLICPAETPNTSYMKRHLRQSWGPTGPEPMSEVQIKGLSKYQASDLVEIEFQPRLPALLFFRNGDYKFGFLFDMFYDEEMRRHLFVQQERLPVASRSPSGGQGSSTVQKYRNTELISNNSPNQRRSSLPNPQMPIVSQLFPPHSALMTPENEQIIIQQFHSGIKDKQFRVVADILTMYGHIFRDAENECVPYSATYDMLLAHMVPRGSGLQRKHRLTMTEIDLETPLRVAIRTGSLEMVQLLVELGYFNPLGLWNPEERSTTLMTAAEGGHEAITVYLAVYHHVPLSTQDLRGNTVLHRIAFRYGMLPEGPTLAVDEQIGLESCAKRLLVLGASICTKNNAGCTALDLLSDLHGGCVFRETGLRSIMTTYLSMKSTKVERVQNDDEIESVGMNVCKSHEKWIGLLAGCKLTCGIIAKSTVPHGRYVWLEDLELNGGSWGRERPSSSSSAAVPFGDEPGHSSTESKPLRKPKSLKNCSTSLVERPKLWCQLGSKRDIFSEDRGDSINGEQTIFSNTHASSMDFHEKVSRQSNSILTVEDLRALLHEFMCKALTVYPVTHSETSFECSDTSSRNDPIGLLETKEEMDRRISRADSIFGIKLIILDITKRCYALSEKRLRCSPLQGSQLSHIQPHMAHGDSPDQIKGKSSRIKLHLPPKPHVPDQSFPLAMELSERKCPDFNTGISDVWPSYTCSPSSCLHRCLCELEKDLTTDQLAFLLAFMEAHAIYVEGALHRSWMDSGTRVTWLKKMAHDCGFEREIGGRTGMTWISNVMAFPSMLCLDFHDRGLDVFSRPNPKPIFDREGHPATFVNSEGEPIVSIRAEVVVHEAIIVLREVMRQWPMHLDVSLKHLYDILLAKNGDMTNEHEMQIQLAIFIFDSDRVAKEIMIARLPSPSHKIWSSQVISPDDAYDKARIIKQTVSRIMLSMQVSRWNREMLFKILVLRMRMLSRFNCCANRAIPLVAGAFNIPSFALEHYGLAKAVPAKRFFTGVRKERMPWFFSKNFGTPRKTTDFCLMDISSICMHVNLPTNRDEDNEPYRFPPDQYKIVLQLGPSDLPMEMSVYLFGRTLLFESTITALWKRVMDKMGSSSHEQPTVHLDRGQAATAYSLSHTVWHQATSQLLAPNSAGKLRGRPGDRPFMVVFRGEGATDFGGPFQEFLSSLAREVMANSADPEDGYLPSFSACIPCPNSTHAIGPYQDTVILKPDHVRDSFEHLYSLIIGYDAFGCDIGKTYSDGDENELESKFVDERVYEISETKASFIGQASTNGGRDPSKGLGVSLTSIKGTESRRPTTSLLSLNRRGKAQIDVIRQLISSPWLESRRKQKRDELQAVVSGGGLLPSANQHGDNITETSVSNADQPAEEGKTGDLSEGKDENDRMVMQMYEVLGRLMAMCYCIGTAFNVLLNPIIWKKLVSQPINIEDLSDSDCVAVEMLRSLRRMANVPAALWDSSMVSALSDMTFATEDSSASSYELVQGGANTSVTPSNLSTFIKLSERCRVFEGRKGIEALLKGVGAVLPLGRIRLLFDWRRLEQGICGDRDIDLDLLKSRSVCSSETLKDQLFQILEGFSNSQRQKFLRFVSGRSRLPTGSDDWKLTIEYESSERLGIPCDSRLPTAGTCSFRLLLPRYSSIHVMKQRLLYALNNCTAIDLDAYVVYDQMELLS